MAPVIDLHATRENLEFMLESFRSLPRPRTPNADDCEACLLAGRRYRQHAIALLLTEADGERFFAGLLRAAELRRDLLAAIASSPKEFAEYRHVGGGTGFFDALAAGNPSTAGEIARVSTSEWQPDYEYEDDYWYAKALHEFVLQDLAPDARVAEIMESLRRAAEGKMTPQLRLCGALLAGDTEGFRTALLDRVREHQETFARKGEGIIADPDEFATERHVFVEGLALKLLARTRGILVDDEDPLMPREAWIGRSR
jgi:hypothetical protein